MADEEHLALLKQGVSVWNGWRVRNPEVRPNLRGAYLSGAYLREADLSRADLSGLDLSGLDLREADLSRADLSGADLSGAYLSGADLSRADLSGLDLSGLDLRGADLSGADLSGADLSEADLSRADLSGLDLSGLDLRGADLRGADLRGADLSLANLSGANLSEANLREANLTGASLERAYLIVAQALGTNFNTAKFTGACLSDWNINSATQLDEVICDYVYLQPGQNERRPSSGNFAPGDFTRLFQKVLETVDLIFRDGIDWQAFLTSFQKLQVESGGSELSIQAIEKKTGGAFVIRVEVPPDADKAKIEESFWQKYKPLLETRDEQIAFYRQEIELKRKENTKLLGIIETMAEKENAKYYLHKPNIGNLVDTARDSSHQEGVGVQHNYVPEPKQTLARAAAAEIKQLLEQLEKTNPTATEAEKRTVVAKAADEIKNNPTLKARVIAALKSGGTEAFKKAVDNPLVDILVAIIEGWTKAE